MNLCQKFRHCLRILSIVVIIFMNEAAFAQIDPECSQVSECEDRLESYLMNQNYGDFRSLYNRLIQKSPEIKESINNAISYNMFRIDFKDMSFDEKQKTIRSYLGIQEFLSSNTEISTDVVSHINSYLKINSDLIDFSMKSTEVQVQILNDQLNENGGDIYFLKDYFNVVSENRDILIDQFLNKASLNQLKINQLLVDAILSGSAELLTSIRQKIGKMDASLGDLNPICHLMNQIKNGDDDLDYRQSVDTSTMEIFFESLSDDEKKTVCGEESFFEFYMNGRQVANEVEDNNTSESMVLAKSGQKKSRIYSIEKKKYLVSMQPSESCQSLSWNTSVDTLIYERLREIYQKNWIRQKSNTYIWNYRFSKSCQVHIEIQGL